MAEKHTSDETLLKLIPRDAFESHMHVVDLDIQHLSPTRVYTPPPAPLRAALDALEPLLPQICIVQPSIYGLDNSCTLSALKTLGKKRACAVIVVDPSAVSEEQMREWNEAGVRGVRINIVTGAKELDRGELEEQVRSRADLIRPWGWALQLYAPMAVMDILGDMLPSLGVPVVLDHFAYPPSPLSHSPPGLSATLSALSNPASQFYIKISAPYRIDLPLSDIRTFFNAYYHAGPDRLVFATDWPHTMYEGFDTDNWVKTVAGWCVDVGGEEAVQKLFHDNAETLWRGREKLGLGS